MSPLVQVRDLFTDPWTAPFDATNDRHVARPRRRQLEPNGFGDGEHMAVDVRESTDQAPCWLTADQLGSIFDDAGRMP